jgi:hypothetical protein
MEQDSPEDEDACHLDVAHEHEGEQLAQHEVRLADRSDDELLKCSPLPFACDGDARNQQQRQTEEHANQSRHDVDGATERRVVPRPHPDLERGRTARVRISDRRRAHRRGQRRTADSRGRGKRIRRIHDHLRVRRPMPLDVPMKIRRNNDRGTGAARLDPVPHLVSALNAAGNSEVLRLLHYRYETPALGAARFVEDDCREIADFHAYRVAEQHELDDRNTDDDHERQPVATHLDELLAKHRPQKAPVRAPDAHTAAPSSRR